MTLENSSKPRSGNVRSPQAKGHDAVLKAIQTQERQVAVRAQSGETYRGLIVGRDKYTITVKGSDGVRWLIYKHAIEALSASELPAGA